MRKLGDSEEKMINAAKSENLQLQVIELDINDD
jgi:hypothetical protein